MDFSTLKQKLETKLKNRRQAKEEKIPTVKDEKHASKTTSPKQHEVGILYPCYFGFRLMHCSIPMLLALSTLFFAVLRIG